jgi:hypothetical protein
MFFIHQHGAALTAPAPLLPGPSRLWLDKNEAPLKLSG